MVGNQLLRLCALGSVVLASGAMLMASASCSSSSAAPAVTDSGATDAVAAVDGGATAPVGDAAGAMCDPIKQDCPDPSLKCTYIKVGSMHFAACEPSVGQPTQQEGDQCTRTDVGFDNCVAGTHCFHHGAYDLYACRKECSADSQCATNEKCAAITDVAPNYYGVCVPTCTPFGSECTGGFNCSNAYYDDDGVTNFDGCRHVGSAGIGQSCTAQYDCQANMNCYGMNGFTCHLMCDATHPCGDAGTCTLLKGLPNGGGQCE